MYYELHDYEIDSVILEDERIIFSFPNGFYVEDENGQPIEPPKKKLVFYLDVDGYHEESCIFIHRITWNRRWKEISFDQFAALFKKGNMIIHDEYDSKYTNWKILQMNACTRCSNIEMVITDVVGIECLDS